MYLRHGGDRQGFLEDYGRPPLDFSANVAPLGLPPAVLRAARQALPEADAYPDPLCRELSRKIAQSRGLQPRHILCGCGAADLIFRLVAALRPARALLPAPAFAEYEAALTALGCGVERVTQQAENGFVLDENFLRAVQPGVGLVFVCQPCNPTGVATPRAFLERLLARCKQVGAVLCVDECFVDFMADPEAVTLRERVAESKNLVLLKAFTKIYAMAGLRLGWCECGDEALLAKMRAAGQPWAVSNVAQAAGLAALNCTDYVAAVRALVGEQRPRMQAALAELGFSVVPASTNYILFKSNITDLGGRAARRGLLLRDCQNYPGLCAGWYRTAVRTGPENERMLTILREICHE